MDFKTSALVALVLEACPVLPVRGDEQSPKGMATVHNFMEDPIKLNNCHDERAGDMPVKSQLVLPPKGQVLLNRQWTCHFEWTEGSSNCANHGGANCAVHTKVVKLWETQGTVAPCIECFWKVQADGFYRRQAFTDHIWHFIYAWE